MTPHGERQPGHRRQAAGHHAGGRPYLPAPYYTDAEYFSRELDALFRTMWICAGRADEIAQPGQFVVREVAGDSVIITRSADGGVHAFHNVCRHRGTRLCTETSGTFPGSIQCPYHAWTYGLDGRLIGAPHMDEVPHFRKEDFPLHRVHADICARAEQVALAKRVALGEMGVMTVGALLILTLALRAFQTGGA